MKVFGVTALARGLSHTPLTFRKISFSLLTLCVLSGAIWGCVSRQFNTDDNEGAEAQRLTASRKDSANWEMTSLKETVFKSLSGGTGDSRFISVNQKCIVPAGTRVSLQRTATSASSGHFRVVLQAALPARNATAQTQNPTTTSRSQTTTPRASTTTTRSTSPARAEENESLLLNSEGTGTLPFKNPITFKVNKPKEDLESNEPVLTLDSAPAFANDSKPCPFQEGYIFGNDWMGDVLPPTTPAAELAERFLAEFKSCSSGASYSLGSATCNSSLDCSSSIQRAYQRMGVNMQTTQADMDPNFTQCSGGVKPGDHLLLGYSCSEPDHWVTLVRVNRTSPANSSENVIVDVSSDCNGLCPVQAVRSNLARRAVCACARWKKLDEAWKAE
jgi:cell wall-associated NlpC family hydrolase